MLDMSVEGDEFSSLDIRIWLLLIDLHVIEVIG